MFEKNNDNIDTILKKTIALLVEHNEYDWCFILKKLLHRYYDPRFQKETVGGILNIYKGGMGSFLDLILQRNYKMPRGFPLQMMENYDNFTQENEKLESLRAALYDACVDYERKIDK